MRLPTLLLLALLLPGAGATDPAPAQGGVLVTEIDVPDRTVAGKPFPVAVRLQNDGPARSVHLFGALYRHVEGEGPCGPATDPRFRAFTHMVQETVRLPANGALDFPPPGERWLHRYEAADAPAQPRAEEFCVFVANATSGPTLSYAGFGATRLMVRATNAPPQASFSWEPERPGATQDVRFRAEATDAEGDPVAFRWDFGHENASGRAVAQGAAVTHFFYPAGEYVVTLVATDGMDETRVAHTVHVAAGAAVEEERLIPFPALLVVLALLAAARPRRREGREGPTKIP